jgi:glycosyltransferase involved in cell wall biosynthesis
MAKKLISIVSPCYNEEENVSELYERVKKVMSTLAEYEYEHIFIDNASKDRTVDILRQIAGRDTNVKVIVNARNFGHIRSPYYALLQARGDAVISIVADLQDPPELITTFVKKWEAGYRIVVGVKEKSEEAPLFFAVRKFYYNVIGRLSEINLIKNFTGFGLYDRKVVEILRQIDDPYPYFRGLICDIGFERAEIPYIQPIRRRGFTKNNFYTLYDIAILGITNHSKVPLRLATMSGFLLAFLSLLVACGYFIYKVIFWNSFTVGIAPLVIGLFFFGSVQLFFIGIIGEYIGSIHTQVLKRPLVVEKERINFD